MRQRVLNRTHELNVSEGKNIKLAVSLPPVAAAVENEPLREADPKKVSLNIPLHCGQIYTTQVFLRALHSSCHEGYLAWKILPGFLWVHLYRRNYLYLGKMASNFLESWVEVPSCVCGLPLLTGSKWVALI